LHEALEELDGIDRLIDWIAIEKLMMNIHAKWRRGRRR
jgi:hypothetical protein